MIWLRGNITAIVTIVAGVLLAGSMWWAYGKGYDIATAKHERAIAAQVAAGEALNEERRRVAAERDDLARQLEETANADPVVVERCLGPSRVFRLNSLN